MSATKLETPVTKCLRCDEPIVQAAGRGRRRQYCNATCRQAAHRTRREWWSWMEENAPQQSAPAARLDAGVPAPGQSDVDDVGATILAAAMVVSELRRHAVAAPPRIRARCATLADAIDVALMDQFAEVFE
jgi:hypothetical protein